jgi:hypothetical protein
MVRRLFLALQVLAAAAALWPSLSFAQGAVSASPPERIEPLTPQLQQHIRRGRFCTALAGANYQSATQRMSAMRSAGGKWADLAAIAGASAEAERAQILEIGYRMKCDHPISDAIEDGAYRIWPVAAALTSIFAAFAAVVAFVSFLFTRKSTRFSNAVGLYRRYLELCIRYPTYAEPEKRDNITEANPDEYRKYQWFLGVLFRACEEVLEHGDDKRKWAETVKDQLGYHLEFLRTNTWLRDTGMGLYSARLRRLIREVLREASRRERDLSRSLSIQEYDSR